MNRLLREEKGTEATLVDGNMGWPEKNKRGPRKKCPGATMKGAYGLCVR